MKQTEADLTDAKSRLCRLLLHLFEDPQKIKTALSWRRAAEEDAERERKRKRSLNDDRSSSAEEVFGSG